MKKLLFILLIIFSSQSFAKSVVGKVLFCDSISFESKFGLIFVNEDHVDFINIEYRDLEIERLISRYSINIRNIYIYFGKDRIDRKTLKYGRHKKDQCYLKNSEEELLNYMTNLVEKKKQKILDDNQI